MKIIKLQLLIVIVYCTAFVCKNANAGLSGIENMQYLRLDYIESVKKTLSPFLSEKLKKGELLGLTAIKDNHQTTLIMMTNFHEGSPTYSLQSDGTVSSADLFGSEHPYSLKVDKDAVHICYSPSKCYKYVYVGNIESFLGRMLFSGKYTDMMGNIYKFNNDGTVILNGIMYNYYVSADHIQISHDMIRLVHGEEQNLFKFIFNNGTVALYKIHGEANDVDSNPWLTLKRIADNVGE